MKIRDLLTNEEFKHLENYSEIAINQSEYNTWKRAIYEHLSILPVMIYRNKNGKILGYYINNSILDIIKYDKVMEKLGVKINHIQKNDYYINFPNLNDTERIESILFRYFDKIDYIHVSDNDITKTIKLILDND